LGNTKRAGIFPITFFIGGFPGEQETEFQETLDFINENGQNLGSLVVTPCAISDMQDRLAHYAIREPAHNIFWESKDGSNTFPVRIERIKRIFRTAAANGVPVGIYSRSDESSLEYYCGLLLASYYLWRQSPMDALEHFHRASRLAKAWQDQGNASVLFSGS
jgi:hypothetical protein